MVSHTLHERFIDNTGIRVMLKVLRFKALEVHVKSFPFESYCSTANLHVSRLQCRQRDTISDNHTFFHHFLYLEPSKNNEWKIVLKDHLEVTYMLVSGGRLKFSL